MTTFNTTIATPASVTGSYIAKLDIQTLLGAFTISAEWTDLLLAEAIARAEQTIDSATQCRFAPTERFVVLRGDGSTLLSTLSRTTWPINSIVEVKSISSYDDSFDDDGEVIGASEYGVHVSARAIERYSTVWTARTFNNYRARVSFGYVLTPSAIKKACVLLVREEIQPGYLQQYERLDSEQFPDGYRYQRTVRSTEQLRQGRGVGTGFDVIDILLSPYAFQKPIAIGVSLIPNAQIPDLDVPIKRASGSSGFYVLE